MGDAPKNAGQSITIKQISKMPVVDIDWGEITVTESWGRLFIKKGQAEVVVSSVAYPAFIAAIQHFAPDLPPTLAQALAVPEIRALVEEVRHLSPTPALVAVYPALCSKRTKPAAGCVK